LNDAKKYLEALTVFEKLAENHRRQMYGGVGLVWQGHMLDLLGRREEAIDAYKRALAIPLRVRHDGYGIVLTKEYVEQRIKTPFTSVENRLKD